MIRQKTRDSFAVSESKILNLLDTSIYAKRVAFEHLRRCFETFFGSVNGSLIYLEFAARTSSGFCFYVDSDCLFQNPRIVDSLEQQVRNGPSGFVLHVREPCRDGVKAFELQVSLRQSAPALKRPSQFLVLPKIGNEETLNLQEPWQFRLKSILLPAVKGGRDLIPYAARREVDRSGCYHPRHYATGHRPKQPDPVRTLTFARHRDREGNPQRKCEERDGCARAENGDQDSCVRRCSLSHGSQRAWNRDLCRVVVA